MATAETTMNNDFGAGFRAKETGKDGRGERVRKKMRDTAKEQVVNAVADAVLPGKDASAVSASEATLNAWEAKFRALGWKPRTFEFTKAYTRFMEPVTELGTTVVDKVAKVRQPIMPDNLFTRLNAGMTRRDWGFNLVDELFIFGPIRLGKLLPQSIQDKVMPVLGFEKITQAPQMQPATK